MSALILIFIALVLAARGDYTFFWIFGGIFVLALIGCMFGKKAGASAPRERPRLRIDHPHVIAADEYECTICGRRFSRNTMSCPYCGVRFNGTETDDTEFLMEEDEIEFWEEEEEEGW